MPILTDDFDTWWREDGKLYDSADLKALAQHAYERGKLVTTRWQPSYHKDDDLCPGDMYIAPNDPGNELREAWREMNDAEICRKNGWGIGTRLVGDEGYGPTVIEITGLGRRQLLAVTISHNGKPSDYEREGLWTLSCRDWKPVTR